MICAVGSVFAIPRMTLKVPLSTKMPSLLERSSIGAAARAILVFATATPTAAAPPVSNERFDSNLVRNIVVLHSEFDFVTAAFSQRLQARKTHVPLGWRVSYRRCCKTRGAFVDIPCAKAGA